MREQPKGDGNAGKVFQTTPDIRSVIACFTGTRVDVSQLLGYLRDGHTIDAVLNDFATVM